MASADDQAAQIRIRAETRAGELLRKQEKAKQIRKGAKREVKDGKVIESHGTTQ